MPPLPLDPPTAVLASCVAWTVIGVASGYGGYRLPLTALDHDTWLTRPRHFERDGQVYVHVLRIHRWKDRLPEAGDLFPGGSSKRALGGVDDAALRRFAAETRRAELVHWANLVAGPVFLLWCPPVVGATMFVFGVAAHLPFICIQRSNRARIERILRRRTRIPR